MQIEDFDDQSSKSSAPASLEAAFAPGQAPLMEMVVHNPPVVNNSSLFLSHLLEVGNESGPLMLMFSSVQNPLNQWQQALNTHALRLNCPLTRTGDNLSLVVTMEGSTSNFQQMGFQPQQNQLRMIESEARIGGSPLLFEAAPRACGAPPMSTEQPLIITCRNHVIRKVYKRRGAALATCGVPPEEVTIDKLLSPPSVAGAQEVSSQVVLKEGPLINLDLQMGMMPFGSQLNDPVLETFSLQQNLEAFRVMPKSNVDSVRLWAKHFAPISSSNCLPIPHEWSDFYTMLLLNPTRFVWVKEFHASKVWEFLVQ
jgi:hypothetical protein